MHRLLSPSSPSCSRPPELLIHSEDAATDKTFNAKEIYSWLARPDKGAVEYAHKTKRRPFTPIPDSRPGMAAYMADASSKLAYLAKIIWEGFYGSEEMRGGTIVFCNWPLDQVMVEAYLEATSCSSLHHLCGRNG